MTAIGKIIRDSKKTVEGSYRQNAWDDTWQNEYEFVLFDESISDAEVEKRIRDAFRNDPRNQPESSWGRLRWSAGENIVSVDVPNRKIITSQSMRLCD